MAEIDRIFKKIEKDSSKERINKRRNKFLEMGNF